MGGALASVAAQRADQLPGTAERCRNRFASRLGWRAVRAADDGKGEFLHSGIAARSFERRFQLADFIEAGDARFENGLLSIALKRVVPEAMKPRKIEIAGGTGDSDQLEAPKGENSAAA